MVTDEVYWSDEMFRITGSEPRTVTMEWLNSLIHEADIPQMLEVFQAAHDGQKSSELIYRIIRPNGEIRHIQDRWKSTFDDMGREIYRVGTSQDISERKQAEEQLQKNAL